MNMLGIKDKISNGSFIFNWPAGITKMDL